MNKSAIIMAIVLVFSAFCSAVAQNPDAINAATKKVARIESYDYDKYGNVIIETLITYKYDSLGRVTFSHRINYNGSVEKRYHTYHGCVEKIDLYINDELFGVEQITYQDSTFQFYEVNHSFPTYQKPLSYTQWYANSPDETYLNEFVYDSLGREVQYRWETPTFVTTTITEYSPFMSIAISTTESDSYDEPEIKEYIHTYEDVNCTRLSTTIGASDMTVRKKVVLDSFGNELERVFIDSRDVIDTYTIRQYNDRREIYHNGRLSMTSFYVE